MYALAQFRLNALDRRVPLAASATAAFLATILVLPPAAQAVVFTTIPIALIWVFRTTINHARSFEDALRRIEQIELAVNRLAGAELMLFQSRHPSRGRATGGRTGAETIRAVFIACGLAILACTWLALPLLSDDVPLLSCFAAYLSLVAALLTCHYLDYRRYRYQPSSPT